MAARSKSSARWLRAQRADPYARRARREGLPSRAAYKLQELDERDGLLRPGLTVLDLGAAPGGWSTYAAGRVRPGGRVIAVDLLPMAPAPGVEYIQGDFRDEAIYRAILERVAGTPVGLVMSDMAPNISGVRIADQARAMELATLALEAARRVLAPDGALLLKTFQGEGYPEFLSEMRKSFRRVAARKPDASRARSAEMYLLGRDLAL